MKIRNLILGIILFCVLTGATLAVASFWAGSIPATSAAIIAALGYTPVPTTTTVNGHALSGNVTVTLSDVGGAPLQGTEINGNVTGSLSSAQVSGTVIYNTGMGATPSTQTLPAADKGRSFIGYCGETSAAQWEFLAASPGTMCLDGTCGLNYIATATPAQGNYVTCYSGQMPTAYQTYNDPTLAIGSTPQNIASIAFTFDVAGTGYSKAAVAAGTAIGAQTIPVNKWGLWRFSIVAAGTITVTPAAGNATGYNSEALAIAALPALPSVSADMGYITVMDTTTGGFVAGTTALNAAGVTANYYSSQVVTTVPYGWYCKSGPTAWTHN